MFEYFLREILETLSGLRSSTARPKRGGRVEKLVIVILENLSGLRSSTARAKRGGRVEKLVIPSLRPEAD